MVCEKCQSKLNRVICPDVAKKPLYKTGLSGPPTGGAAEERKVPLYKQKQAAAAQAASVSEILDFAGITTSSLTEVSMVSGRPGGAQGAASAGQR